MVASTSCGPQDDVCCVKLRDLKVLPSFFGMRGKSSREASDDRALTRRRNGSSPHGFGDEVR